MRKFTLITLFLCALIFETRAQVKYYINSNTGQPWGSTTNAQSMNAAFGAGNWTQAYFQTVNVNALFQPTVCFIFLEGSDGNANALNTFLTNNMTALQNWVSAGGKLFINAAPNQGGNINFGFGGVTLNYPVFSTPGTAAPGMTAYPIFNGPAVPTGTTFTGNSYAHASITGGTLVTVMDGQSAPVLSERFWGLGRVMFGGMTTTNFHSPSPNGTNLRSNIFSLLGGCCGAGASITAVANPSQVCAGQNVTITVSGAASYTAWPGNGTGTTSIVFSPPVSGNYNVIGTPTAGCPGGVTIPLSVVPAPVLAISGNTAICPNGSTTLTASGANSYTWNGNVFTSTVALSPTVTTTYTLEGTNGGCVTTQTQMVTLNPNPTITIAGNPSVCAGGSFSLTAQGANNYTWSNGPTTPSIVVTPSVTTNYSVIGSTTAGCTGTFAQTFTVNPNPTLAITGETAAICAGSAANVTVTGASSYQWNHGPTTAAVSLSPQASTSYTVVGTSNAGCSTVAVHFVSVVPIPNVTALGPGTVCQGQSANLMAFGASTYSWSNGAQTASNVIMPNANTTLTVVGSVPPGCSNSATVVVSVSQNPSVTATGPGTICLGESANLVAGGASTYSWSNGSSSSSITVMPTSNTNYTVNGYNNAGCLSSAVISVTVFNCQGIESHDGANAFISIYPNPNQGVFTIESSVEIQSIEISDISGRLVHTQKVGAAKALVNISQLANGVYYTRVIANNGSQVLKITRN